MAPESNPAKKPKAVSTRKFPNKNVSSAGEDTIQKTSKSSQSPQFKVVLNYRGILVITLLGILKDLIILWNNFYYSYRYGFFNWNRVVGQKSSLKIVTIISFISAIFSELFLWAVLVSSGLTMQKGKRLKMAPFLVFSFFKLLIFLWFGSYTTFFGILFVDILLYVCLSHTAKNIIVRKYFKPYKQVVYYN